MLVLVPPESVGQDHERTLGSRTPLRSPSILAAEMPSPRVTVNMSRSAYTDWSLAASDRAHEDPASQFCVVRAGDRPSHDGDDRPVVWKLGHTRVGRTVGAADRDVVQRRQPDAGSGALVLSHELAQVLRKFVDGELTRLARLGRRSLIRCPR